MARKKSEGQMTAQKEVILAKESDDVPATNMM
jgi:hypothetical protein